MQSFSSSLLLSSFLLLASPLSAAPKTTVSIVGDQFHINGQPTYAGRTWKGQ